MNRRLPPFGAQLRTRLATGWTPDNGTLFVAVGDGAWDQARSWSRAFIVIPPGEQIEVFDLSVSRGLDAVIADTGGIDQTYLQGLAVALISAGAGLVYSYRVGTGEPGQTFRPMPVTKAAA